MSNDGGPAFPHNASNPGMTLRDWFAGEAMQAYITASKEFDEFRDYAESAYKQADAMLTEREKK